MTPIILYNQLETIFKAFENFIKFQTYVLTIFRF